MKLTITIESDNSGYLATANGCTGWDKDPRTAIAKVQAMKVTCTLAVDNSNRVKRQNTNPKITCKPHGVQIIGTLQ